VVVFRTLLRDELVPFEVASDPGRTFFRNVGKSSHRGIEVAVRGEMEGGLSLRSALTHVVAEFDSGLGEEVDGNRIPGRATTRFETRASLNRSGYTASLDLTWAKAMPVDDENTAEAPSWFRIDLRVGLDALLIGKASILPWLEVGNVTDADYVGSVTVNAFGGRYFEPAPGRTFSMGLRVGLR
jgi:iron complex outermembrane receptor protein